MVLGGRAITVNQVRDISLQIFQTLKENILNLDYAPGMPVCESEICEQFSVSRTPVRTAMQRLSDRGLIDILPYQKSRVSLIDLDAVRQLIYARTAIETRLVFDFVKLEDSRLHFEDVDHLIRKQQIVLEAPDFHPRDFYFLDAQMHRLWYTASGKERLWEYFHNSIHYTRMRLLDIKEVRDYEDIISEHKQILDHMREGRVEKIVPLMDLHFKSTLLRLEGRMNSDLAGFFA